MVAGPGRMVVVVEDDESMREALERLLRAGGFDCASYTKADSLLAGGVDDHAVCVVSDFRLPGMTGLDLLAVLRERGIALPFILITGHDTPGMRQEALRRGASAYLAKPFRGTVLLQTVSAAIDAPRPS